MKSKKLKGRVTISYPRSRNGNTSLSIIIKDDMSGIKFAELQLENPKDIVSLMSGLGGVPCDIKARGLDKVGKEREIKHISLDLLAKNIKYKRDKIKENMLEEINNLYPGWHYHSGLDSQGGVSYSGDKIKVKVSIVKWE